MDRMSVSWRGKILGGMVVLGIATGMALADGSEALGPPLGLSIAAGTGIVAGGTGVDLGPGTINITVPAGASVEQVLLYWEGFSTTMAGGDDTITVNAIPVMGSLIGGPTEFFTNAWAKSYRADITAMGLVVPGVNALAIAGFDFDRDNNGAGVLVIFDAGGDLADIGVRDGSDLAYAGGFLPPLDATVPQTFTFPAASFDRNADFALFAGSVGSNRSSLIRLTSGPSVVDVIDALGSNEGLYWDTISTQVVIPAGATSLQVEVVSGGPGADPPASLDWITASLAVLPPPIPGDCRVSATEKGSVLIFPKVEIRWDAAGNLVQDTYIDIANDNNQDVLVHLYFINGDKDTGNTAGEHRAECDVANGDCLDDNTPDVGCNQVDCCDFICEIDPFCCDVAWDAACAQQAADYCNPGCNWVNSSITLTANEPTFWSALTGMPKGVAPFTSLDEGLPGFQGRPDPEGSGDRILRGYIVAFAKDSDGDQIKWNHLKGDAVLINYRNGTAWEYNAYAFQAPSTVLPTGSKVGVGGTINLNGTEFCSCYDKLLLDFYATGSTALSNDAAVPDGEWTVDTDLTLVPVDLDVTQDSPGPITTKAHWDIWNENEDHRSGVRRCITCWDQVLLSNYQVNMNHFLLSNLGTDKGRGRVEGQASTECPGSVKACLLGVSAKELTFVNEGVVAKAGTNLHGLGTYTATIKFDPVGGEPEPDPLPTMGSQTGGNMKNGGGVLTQTQP